MAEILSQQQIDDLLSSIDEADFDDPFKSITQRKKEYKPTYKPNNIKIKPIKTEHVVLKQERKDKDEEYICYTCKTKMIKNKLLEEKKISYLAYCKKCDFDHYIYSETIHKW